MDAPNYLELSPQRRIAYHKTRGDGDGGMLPGLVFLGGYSSDMTGTKAIWIEDWARARGRHFLRFDYRGHGASSARFEEGTIGDWADDAYEAITRLTEGPQVLIGSSMGGWIALLLARRAPALVAGIIGIAAAPDFSEDGIWAELDEHERRKLMAEGRLELPSDYGDEPMVVTRRLVEEGRSQLVLRSALVVDAPVRLLHGTADADVPQAVALRLLDHLTCPDVRLTLVKGAGHRFSEPSELALIGKTLHGITRATGNDA